MLKLAGEFIEGQLADHKAALDAHTKNLGEVVRTGEYEWPTPTYGLSDIAIAANTLYAFPHWVARKKTYDSINIYLKPGAVSGALLRFGLYAAGTNLYPGALILDIGTIDAYLASGEVARAIAFIQQLDRQICFIAGLCDSVPMLRHRASTYPPLGVTTDLNTRQERWKVTQTFGVLPDPFPAGATLEGPGAFAILRSSSLD